MNAAAGIREEVALPDPEVQPLVHPLDLPESRRLFRNGWLVGALTGLPVSALVAAIIAYAGRTVIGPIMAFVALVVLGTLASRWYVSRSWDYIPRKRQDRDRALPRAWEIASGSILAAVLGVALLLIVFRLGRDDISLPVRSWTLGMAAVVAVLVVADAVIGLARPSTRARAAASVPGVIVVVVAVVRAWTTWFDGQVDPTALLWGAFTMIAVALLAGPGRTWDHRRRS
jgi:hypothetical protein